MAKSSRKTKKNRVVHDVTFQGLNEWYKRKFEKLGWMILAKRDGYMDKVMAYENSIKRLHTAIGQKIEDIHDKDTMADLYIMKENVFVNVRIWNLLHILYRCFVVVNVRIVVFFHLRSI